MNASGRKAPGSAREAMRRAPVRVVFAALIVPVALGAFVSAPRAGVADTPPASIAPITQMTPRDTGVRFPEEVAAAREYFVLGREAERAGDTAAALKWFGLARGLDAGSRDLCFLYLDRLGEAGAVDSAAALARDCEALALRDGRGDTARARFTLAERRSLGMAALRAEDIPRALRHYRAALDAAGPGDETGDLLYALAGLYEATGDWSGHAAVLRQLLPRLGYPARLMDRLARVYARLERTDELTPLLREAWEKTGEPSYGLMLAALYETADRPLSLLAVTRGLAARAPAPLHDLLLARAYAGANRPDSALALTTRLAKAARLPARDQVAAAPSAPRAASADPAEVLFLHASLLFESGRYKEAYALARRLALNGRDGVPAVAAYPFLAGSAALELRRRDAAEWLDEALALAPLAPDLRARRAYALYVEAAWRSRALPDREAVDAAAAARLAYGPRDSLDYAQRLLLEGLAHARLARDLEPRGAWERPSVFADSAATRRHRRQALERFEAILALDTGHRAALFEAGALRERLGDREGSKALLRRLVARDSAHALAMNYLAYTIIEPEAFDPAASPATHVEYEEAGRLLDRALALEPENGAYRDSKGWWHHRGGVDDSARVWLEAAADAMPGDPEVLAHLVIVLHALERRDEACAAWHRLRRIDPARRVYLHCPADAARDGGEP